jgi:hypothetical protein
MNKGVGGDEISNELSVSVGYVKGLPMALNGRARIETWHRRRQVLLQVWPAQLRWVSGGSQGRCFGYPNPGSGLRVP